mmetsp:Transcript_39075/g.91495  ORF Transcript_39075/g.91495 Transcript_39075/m.91495 type:complete len:272 (-) Transcript_39075:922-1737(-)
MRQGWSPCSLRRRHGARRLGARPWRSATAPPAARAARSREAAAPVLSHFGRSRHAPMASRWRPRVRRPAVGSVLAAAGHCRVPIRQDQSGGRVPALAARPCRLLVRRRKAAALRGPAHRVPVRSVRPQRALAPGAPAMRRLRVGRAAVGAPRGRHVPHPPQARHSGAAGPPLPRAASWRQPFVGRHAGPAARCAGAGRPVAAAIQPRIAAGSPQQGAGGLPAVRAAHRWRLSATARPAGEHEPPGPYRTRSEPSRRPSSPRPRPVRRRAVW